ncbi:hypothetical protein EV421DRAFT_563608 [Armillaria borealis]|uniref:Transmembrane protein n=1 Tax=Armillaria borealis TaxID=47425 RepID=A0AA39MDC0_9AGAR|nr:hypothetical protein EV421DRAFT_563608 [Armillaria borealis]
MNTIGKQLQESRCGLSTNFALYGSYCCQAAIAIVTITTLVIGFMGSLSLELVVLGKLAVAIGVVIIVLDYIRRKMSYVLSLCTPVVDGKIIGMALLLRDIIAVRNSLCQEIVRFIWAWKETKRVMRQPLPQDAPAKRPAAVTAQKQRFLSSVHDTVSLVSRILTYYVSTDQYQVFSQGGKLVMKADSLASGLGWKGLEFATTNGSPVTGILMQETFMATDSGVSSASDLSGGRSGSLQFVINYYDHSSVSHVLSRRHRSSGSSTDPLD